MEVEYRYAIDIVRCAFYYYSETNPFSVFRSISEEKSSSFVTETFNNTKNHFLEMP